MSEYRWLNEYSKKFLEQDYLLPNQTVDNRVDIIANRAEEILNKPGFAKKFKSYFQKGWFSLSTPIWTNFGTKRGLPISCFGSYCPDTMEGIVTTHAEVAMMTKHGGGTSGYFGDIRPQGTPITDNGFADGPMHFLKMFELSINLINQGSTRRGNFAAFMNIDNPEIMEFLKIRLEGSFFQNLHFGVTVPDWWMKEMINGDKDKRVVWAKVLERRMERGEPYICFIDNINNNTVDVYKDKGMKVTHSNLCVTGDQRVVSDRGLLTAKELYEQGGKLRLFDNEQVVNASSMQLIEKNAPVYKITLANGMTHTVTEYHKVLTSKGIKTCAALIPGDELAIQTKKGVFGPKHMPEEAFSFGSTQLNNEKIPNWIFESDEETQWSYINGLLLKNKNINQDSCHIYEAVQLILTNFGNINVFISENNLKVCHPDNSYSKITSIEYVGTEDVYCVKVDSDKHLWVCNGVITHNCSEIMLPDNEEESFVCDLSSMNILYYDEWKNTDAVEVLVYLLDAVMTEFIEKARKIKHMERPVRFAERHRALGVGWFGWHSYLQSKMVPFESMEAKLLNVQVAQTVHKQAYKASEKLAKEYGEPELLKGYGRRNTTLLAIAPTKSSAFIIGQASEGIEPERFNYGIKDNAKLKMSWRNPYLAKLLESKGKNTEDVWDSILKSGGSVQHLEFLTQEEKDVFKTISEISPKEIVIQAAARQKYIDQSQSLNLFIHSSTPIKDVNALMIEAWKLGIKSFYYQKNVNAAQDFTRNILACTNCEA